MSREPEEIKFGLTDAELNRLRELEAMDPLPNEFIQELIGLQRKFMGPDEQERQRADDDFAQGGVHRATSDTSRGASRSRQDTTRDDRSRSGKGRGEGMQG